MVTYNGNYKMENMPVDRFFDIDVFMKTRQRKDLIKELEKQLFIQRSTEKCIFGGNFYDIKFNEDLLKLKPDDPVVPVTTVRKRTLPVDDISSSSRSKKAKMHVGDISSSSRSKKAKMQVDDISSSSRSKKAKMHVDDISSSSRSKKAKIHVDDISSSSRSKKAKMHVQVESSIAGSSNLSPMPDASSSLHENLSEKSLTVVSPIPPEDILEPSTSNGNLQPAVDNSPFAFNKSWVPSNPMLGVGSKEEESNEVQGSEELSSDVLPGPSGKSSASFSKRNDLRIKDQVNCAYQDYGLVHQRLNYPAVYLKSLQEKDAFKHWSDVKNQFSEVQTKERSNCDAPTEEQSMSNNQFDFPSSNVPYSTSSNVPYQTLSNVSYQTLSNVPFPISNNIPFQTSSNHVEEYSNPPVHLNVWPNGVNSFYPPFHYSELYTNLPNQNYQPSMYDQSYMNNPQQSPGEFFNPQDEMRNNKLLECVERL